MLVLSESGCGKPEDAEPSGEPERSLIGGRHAEQIEVVIHLYQLIFFNAVDPLRRGECVKITQRSPAESSPRLI